MITVAQIESFFSYFYQKKYNEPKYKLRSTKTTISVCESFLKIADKEYNLHCVGKTFLWDYFLFQFNYWDELELENKFSDKIVIAWIVGKKAFERWKERDREYDWQLETSPIIGKYQLDQKYLFLVWESLEKPQSQSSISVPFDSSKRIRKEHLNTENGFATCILLTTLFDPKDLSCIKCKSRSDCKELLRVNFPKLYNQRGLGV